LGGIISINQWLSIISGNLETVMSDSLKKKLTNLNFRITYKLTEDLYQTLTGFGGRISELLNNSEIIKDKDAIGLLDDLLGAVYSLIHAKYYDFEDRTDKSIEIDVLQKRASQIQNGDVRTDGKWIAGWHFNSALFRIAAVYHRLLKLTDGNTKTKKEYVSTLLGRVKPRYKRVKGVDWSSVRTHAIHEEVNTLKHTPQGVYSARKATFEDALISINELLDLFETWSSTTQNLQVK
jgi:hypothetical protein